MNYILHLYDRSWKAKAAFQGSSVAGIRFVRKWEIHSTNGAVYISAEAVDTKDLERFRGMQISEVHVHYTAPQHILAAAQALL